MADTYADTDRTTAKRLANNVRYPLQRRSETLLIIKTVSLLI